MEGLPWGGSEELWSRSALHLVGRGHYVLASVRGWKRTHARILDLQQAGIDVQERRLGLRDGLSFVADRISGRRGRLLGHWVMMRRIVAKRPDLACISDGGFAGSPLLMNALAAAGIPYLSLGQANWEGLWPTDTLAEQYRMALRGAERCCFVSRANQAMAEAQIGSRLTNAEVVWNPYQVSRNADSAWPEYPDGQILIACVARLEARAKGQDLLLRLMAEKKWRHRPIRLTFYGDGPNADTLQALASELQLGAHVRFVGFEPDIEKIWRDNHLLLLASRYEGMPLALLEALLCRRVCVVTDVGGNAEVIEDGITGFVAAAPCVRCLDDALERAWQVRNEWPQIGSRAGAAIRRLLPLDPVAEFADRLESIAHGSKTGGIDESRVRR